jgi:hypothetical protein
MSEMLQVKFEVTVNKRHEWRSSGRAHLEVEIPENVLEFMNTGNLLTSLIPVAMDDYKKKLAEAEAKEESE